MKKIIGLVVEGFKKIEAVELECNGNIIVVSGKNAQGKSSVLDAIEAALGGPKHSPSKPIKDGKKKATIIVKTEDLIIKRVYTPSGNYLEVTPSTGGAPLKSPQALIDKFMSSLTYDPLNFILIGNTANGRKEQAETVRKLLNIDFSKYDNERLAAYNQRTYLGSRIKDATAKLVGVKYDPKMPKAEISATDLMVKIREANANNESISKLKTSHDILESKIKDYEKTIKELEDKIADIKLKIKSTHEEKVTIYNKMTSSKIIDIESLTKQLENIQEDNRKIRANIEAKNLTDALDKLNADYSMFDSTIAKIDKEKKEAISKAGMPIQGLEFDEEGFLVYNGIPLEQCSSAEGLEVAISMGAKMIKDGIRMMLVRRGNDLDSDTFKRLEALANKYDVQMFIEKIEVDDEFKGAVFTIEDGMLSGKTLAVPKKEEQEDFPI